MSNKSKLALLDDSNFPIDLIEVGQNIRDVSEKEEGIKELADSIEQYGQLEPIGIEFDENENGKFKLVYGNRRFIAISKILKLKFVKVVRVSGNNRVETQLIENIHRKDLTDLELAEALKTIQEQTKCKNKELAKIVSKSVDWVESKLIHLEVFNSLDKETKEQAKELSTDKIKPLRKISETSRKTIIQDTKKENLSVRSIKEEVKKATKLNPNKKVIEARLKKIEKDLALLDKQKEKLKSEKATLTKLLKQLSKEKEKY